MVRENKGPTKTKPKIELTYDQQQELVLDEQQLPEWVRSNLTQENGEFSIDFGHPAAPVLTKQIEDENGKVDLDVLQMFDVVEGKGVIGMIDRRNLPPIDRRAGSRKPIPEPQVPEDLLANEETLNLDDDEEGEDELDPESGKENQGDNGQQEVISKIKQATNGARAKTAKYEENILVGEYVVMLEGKTLKVGQLDDICNAVVNAISDNPELNDTDIVVFQRLPLNIVLDPILKSISS